MDESDSTDFPLRGNRINESEFKTDSENVLNLITSGLLRSVLIEKSYQGECNNFIEVDLFHQHHVVKYSNKLLIVFDLYLTLWC